MHRNYMYVRLDAERQCAITAGIGLRDFCMALPRKNLNVLLLRHDYHQANRDERTGLRYVDGDVMRRLSFEALHCDGDFCWADYGDTRLAHLTDQDMAELIYAAHMQEPLSSPFFDALDNAYLYMSHDDDWWTKLYMRNMRDILPVLEHRIRAVLKGRKRNMPPFQEAFAEKLFAICHEGVLFDVENASDGTDFSYLRYYTVGELDDAERQHAALDRCRKKYHSPGAHIYFGAERQRAWSFEDCW